MKINIVCLLIVITLICQNISCLMKRSKKNREDEFFTSYNILSPYLYTYELKQLLKEKIIEYNSFCNTYLAYIKQNAYYIYLKFNSEQLDEILNDVINNNGQKSKSVKEVIINDKLREIIIKYGNLLKDLMTITLKYESEISCNSTYNFLSFLAIKAKEKEDLNFIKNSLLEQSKENIFFKNQQKQDEINIQNINLLKAKLENPKINYVGIYLSSYDDDNLSNPHYIFLKRKDKNCFYLFQSFDYLYDVDISIKAQKTLTINEICSSLLLINDNPTRKDSLRKLISYGGDVEQINDYFKGPIFVSPFIYNLEERKESIKSPKLFDKGIGILYGFNIIKYCSEHVDCTPDQTV